MRKFAESIVAVAPVTSRKARNRFLRECDQWTERLRMKGFINTQERQALRCRIAEACIAAQM